MISVKGVVLKWYGGPYLEKIKTEEKKRITQATIYLANEVKKLLGVKVGKIGQTVVERSQPGEPPRLETGELRRSIARETVEEGDQIIGRVGTNKKYAKYLELPEYLNRPFLASALRTHRNAISRILIGSKIN